MTCQLFSKEKVKKLTENVAKADLPIPYRVQKKIEKGVKASMFTGTANIDYIQPYKGTLLQRYFMAEKVIEKGKLYFRTAEYARRILGGDFVLSNAYYEFMRGYYAWSPNQDTSKTAWECKTDEVFSAAVSKRPSFLMTFEHIGVDEIIDKYAQHTGAREFFGKYDGFYRFDLMDYLKVYFQRPYVERLVKMGYGQFIPTCLNLLNGKGKNFSEVFGIPAEWKHIIKKTGYTRNDILFLRRFPWIKSEKTMERVKSLLDQYTFDGKYKPYGYNGGEREFSDEEWDYVLKNLDSFLARMYVDYLRNAKKLLWNLDDPKLHFPKNKKQLVKLHDQAAMEYEIKKDLVLDQAIANFSKQAEKYTFHNNQFSVFPVKKSEELVMESEKLHHCVKTYAQLVAEGKTMIFFIRRNDQIDVPYVTMEANLDKKKIIQVRGIRNCEPTEEVKEFVNRWGDKFEIESVFKH